MADAAPPNWRAALERLRGAFADRTLGGYLWQFARFEAWCAARGLTAMPARSETVATYLAEGIERFRFATVKTQMYAIRRVHAAVRLADPTLDQDVYVVMRRGRRVAPAPRQAIALNAPLRDRLAAACKDTLQGRRDLALLLVGYDSLCRRGELIRLRIEDLEALPDGTARIRVRNAKQDISRGQDYAYLSRRSLAALRDWVERAGVVDGPILRAVDKFDRVGGPIREDAHIVTRLRAMARAAGVEPRIAEALTGHAFRVGAAQDLAAAGCSLLEIMRAGRWRNPALVMEYVRRAPVNVWADSDGDAYPLAAQAQAWRRRGTLHPAHAPGVVKDQVR